MNGKSVSREVHRNSYCTIEKCQTPKIQSDFSGEWGCGKKRKKINYSTQLKLLFFCTLKTECNSFALNVTNTNIRILK